MREAAGAGDVVELPPHASEPVHTAVVAVAAGDGIKRIFYSLGVQGIIAGGQSMNPSTAELLVAVEAVPAEEVVILPNNKNIIPVAEQVDAHTDRNVRVVPTRGIAEGFAALASYDPEAGADENAKEMTSLASNVLAGEVTRAGLDQRRGPDYRRRLSRITSDGILAVEQTQAAAAGRLLDLLVTDEHEIVTVIEGEDQPQPTPAPSPSGSTNTTPGLRSRSITAASRSTPTCSASSRPERACRRPRERARPERPAAKQHERGARTDRHRRAPITLGELAAMPVTRLKGVGERKAEGLAIVGVESLLDLLTYYPRRYVDRTNEGGSATWWVGEEALVLVTVQRVSSRRTRGRPPKMLVTVDVTDGSGHLRVSFFNQAWRERQLRAGMTVALFGNSRSTPAASR